MRMGRELEALADLRRAVTINQEDMLGKEYLANMLTNLREKINNSLNNGKVYERVKRGHEESIINRGRFQDYGEDDLGFIEMAQTIVNIYMTGPRTFQEQCLGAMKMSNLTPDTASMVVVKNVETRFYRLNSDTPEDISREGQEVYEKLKRVYCSVHKDPELRILSESLREEPRHVAANCRRVGIPEPK